MMGVYAGRIQHLDIVVRACVVSDSLPLSRVKTPSQSIKAGPFLF